jgi:hypothetical protein
MMEGGWKKLRGLLFLQEAGDRGGEASRGEQSFIV